MRLDYTAFDLFKSATRLETLLYGLGVVAMLVYIFTRVDHCAILRSPDTVQLHYMFGDKAGHWREVGKAHFFFSYYGTYWLVPCLVTALAAVVSARKRLEKVQI